MTSIPPESTSSPSTPISERVAVIALAVERYVLPWIYVWFAYQQISIVHHSYAKYQTIIRIHHGMQGISWPIFWADVTKYVLLSCLSTFSALTLFLSRRPTHLPKNLAQIVTPLAMSYYFFLYPMVNSTSVPEDLRASFLPEEWKFPAAIAAVFFSIVGYAVSIWGLLYLRRSFALLVAVREVVSGGPYAYVRHPMYLGYVIELIGLLLSSLCLGMIILAAGFIVLLVIRAGLEEERLVEACPAYRDYMKRTGFIFPRFGRKPSAVS